MQKKLVLHMKILSGDLINVSQDLEGMAPEELVAPEDA